MTLHGIIHLPIVTIQRVENACVKSKTERLSAGQVSRKRAIHIFTKNKTFWKNVRFPQWLKYSKTTDMVMRVPRKIVWQLQTNNPRVFLFNSYPWLETHHLIFTTQGSLYCIFCRNLPVFQKCDIWLFYNYYVCIPTMVTWSHFESKG